MRLFRKGRVEDPTEHTDPRLVDAVRALGQRWGTTPVALTAAYLSNPKLVRDLISAEARYISFDSNREFAERYADQEGTRRSAIDEIAGTLPPGRLWPEPTSAEAALIQAGNRLAELQGVVNTVYLVAQAAVSAPFDHRPSSVLQEVVELTRAVASTTRGKDDDTSRDDQS